jgi:hypothetical protein
MKLIKRLWLKIKHNETAWDIWRELTEAQRAALKKGSYPDHLIEKAVKSGCDAERLRQELKRRTYSL